MYVYIYKLTRKHVYAFLYLLPRTQTKSLSAIHGFKTNATHCNEGKNVIKAYPCILWCMYNIILIPYSQVIDFR